MKETTPANKKTRKAFKHNASTRHGHEQAASGANTSTDPLGAYKLPEFPQLPDAAQLLADNKAHLEEVAQQVRAKPELSPLPALPDLKPVNVEAVMRDVDAAGVQAVNVLEEVAQRDTALFESLEIQGGDVIG